MLCSNEPILQKPSKRNIVQHPAKLSNIVGPSHYLSAPALSYDAMSNMTKVDPELISDAELCLLFEKYMRERVC